MDNEKNDDGLDDMDDLDENLEEEDEELIIQDPEIETFNKIKSLIRKTGLLLFDKTSKYHYYYE